MPSTTSLISSLERDFPAISFVAGDTFRWSPEDSTIYYKDAPDAALLLHEVAHAALGHSVFNRDIELLQMERDAWDYAVDVLAKKYRVKVSQDTAQSMLDTYRDWLHARSTCPECEATGLQTTRDRYTCLACKSSWKVNEARSCALRRYQLS